MFSKLSLNRLAHWPREYLYSNMEKKDIQKEMLKPITKANSTRIRNCRNGKLNQLKVEETLTTKRVRIVLFKGENL
jgi:hypothetical protein